jgi:hypothetical protein
MAALVPGDPFHPAQSTPRPTKAGGMRRIVAPGPTPGRDGLVLQR